VTIILYLNDKGRIRSVPHSAVLCATLGEALIKLEAGANWI